MPANCFNFLYSYYKFPILFRIHCLFLFVDFIFRAPSGIFHTRTGCVFAIFSCFLFVTVLSFNCYGENECEVYACLWYKLVLKNILFVCNTINIVPDFFLLTLFSFFFFCSICYKCFQFLIVRFNRKIILPPLFLTFMAI